MSEWYRSNEDLYLLVERREAIESKIREFEVLVDREKDSCRRCFICHDL